MTDSKDLELDNPLASDLSVQAQLVNMYRVRGDKHFAIVDLGYTPPILPHEDDLLKNNPAPVHTRLAIPYELVAQLVETLTVTAEAARRFHGGGAPAPGAARPAAGPAGLRQVKPLK